MTTQLARERTKLVRAWGVAAVGFALAAALLFLLLTRHDAAAAPPVVTPTPTATPSIRPPYVAIYDSPPGYPDVAAYCDGNHGVRIYISTVGQNAVADKLCPEGGK